MEKNLRTNSLSEIERVLKTRLIHDTHELAKRLELDEIVTPTTEKAAKITPTLFPESLLNRVQKGNAEDPILLQFMPSPHELETKKGAASRCMAVRPKGHPQRGTPMDFAIAMLYASFMGLIFLSLKSSISAL